jgi:uncharacterized protein (TIGR00297 family)
LNFLVSIAAATGVSAIAFALRLLTAGGAAAAAVVGTIVFLAGVDWAFLLLFFFLTSSALSRLIGDRTKGAAIQQKGDRRDFAQVMANGSVFAASAAAFVFTSHQGWAAAACGAIASATADTWSTELGMAWGGEPRHLLTGTRLPAGMSGGVTWLGSAAAFAGAVSTALLAHALQFGVPVHVVVAGGLAGAFGDSLLGATIQERRWCDVCGTATERAVHRCGTKTLVRGGIRRFGNDAVNLTSIAVGALVSWLLY